MKLVRPVKPARGTTGLFLNTLQDSSDNFVIFWREFLAETKRVKKFFINLN